MQIDTPLTQAYPLIDETINSLIEVTSKILRGFV